MSRMLSTISNWLMPYDFSSSCMSLSTSSGARERYAMLDPLSPQNVHWCRAPHQQPREASSGSPGRIIGASREDRSSRK